MMEQKENELKEEGTFSCRKDENGQMVFIRTEPVKVISSSRITEGERLLKEFRQNRKAIVPG